MTRLFKKIEEIRSAQYVGVQVLLSLAYLGLAAYGILEWAGISESCTSFLDAENWGLLLNLKALTCFMCLGFITHVFLNALYFMTDCKKGDYERIPDEPQGNTAAPTTPTAPASASPENGGPPC